MINRFIFNTLQNEIAEPQVDILLGPRQAGKTTLLKQLQIHVTCRGLKTKFYDLEQPQVLAQFNRSDAESPSP